MNELNHTSEQLETAFEFLRIANDRGGFVYDGAELHGLPSLITLLHHPEDHAHLPKPPNKVMMQMWRDYGGNDTAYPACYEMSNRTKIGEPFEFVYPEGDNT